MQQQLNGISISQTKYVVDLLKQFRMMSCTGVATPVVLGEKLTKDDPSPPVDPTLYKRLVGSLVNLTITRPDIMYVVGLISQFMQVPHEPHWRVSKRILQYVNGTHNFGIHYFHNYKFELAGYMDSDWVG